VLVSRPVEVAPADAPASVGAEQPVTQVAAARIRVLVVTWNRKAHVENILRSLSRQTYPLAAMDVTVIDNASTDGTLEHLRDLFMPDAVVFNRTDEAHRPNFQTVARTVDPDEAATEVLGGTTPTNLLGFRSLTIIRNQANLGGCGGFNTGFGFTEWLATRDPRSTPDFLWLVDDDADVPPDALDHLTRAMNAAPDIGLVGSRTVNIEDRATTIETTIYYNFWTGAMQDDCPPENPKRASWERWFKDVGQTRGKRDFTGQIDVDVVSACSMLARWSAVTGAAGERPAVGFWDWRYFIYCDDADWCLRFARSGWRVVLNLDAVVYHTPWNLKLTPARIYYANRNKVWMGQKVLRGSQLRQVTRRALQSILKDSLKAALHRRLFHAHIILDTARDIVIGRAGKTGSDGPPAEPIAGALRRLGLTGRQRRVAVLVNRADGREWFDRIASAVAADLSPSTAPTLLPVFRNDVPSPPSGSLIYGARRASRIKKQFHLWRLRPDAVIVIDQTNDLPVLFRGGINLHLDTKKPGHVQVETDGWGPRLRFLTRWMPNAARCLWYALTIKPYSSPDKYG
jgi:GT2 family glycosyltransferase